MATAKKSRKELASTLGCPVQASGMVITGGGKRERGLSAENNVKAARYLGVDSDWLATGEGEMTPSAPLRNTEKLSEDALEIASVPIPGIADPLFTEWRENFQKRHDK